ncbi:hypothetical protein HPB48_021677 [Haemaphysalis longicornis]|uniref:Reverse transcriptase domain-containing protein n=1 Tax=Haemaphysalis longicornis TaxID=44386 RepID=A0A9J6G0U8_HAELO|nr:hypothetical protein HPB48_021677 [Haemaphysalis longicornis]
MAKEEHDRKAKEALLKNFHEMCYDHKRLKLTENEAANLCERLHLEKLEKSVKENKGLCLTPLLSVKTHKPENPFRVIIEDKVTWQKHVAKYLQLHLAKLRVQDTFIFQESQEVIEFLREKEPVTCVSFDVKDMYYNIPQRAAFATVQDSIDRFESIRFHLGMRQKCQGFLELLRLYLQ